MKVYLTELRPKDRRFLRWAYKAMRKDHEYCRSEARKQFIIVLQAMNRRDLLVCGGD